MSKMAILGVTERIIRKRCIVAMHMLQGVFPASDLLSLHTTYTVLTPGAYPGGAKMCQKWRILDLLIAEFRNLYKQSRNCLLIGMPFQALSNAVPRSNPSVRDYEVPQRSPSHLTSHTPSPVSSEISPSVHYTQAAVIS